jgi:hypothetical protein
MATTQEVDSDRNAFQQAWDRLTAGNIDDPKSEASLRYRDASGAIQDKRNSDADLVAMQSPKVEPAADPTEADVKAQMPESSKDPQVTPEMTKAAEAEGESDAWKEQFADKAMADTPVAVVKETIVKAPAKVIAKPVAAVVEPLGESAKDRAAKNPVVAKPEIKPEIKPNTFGSKLPMPKGALEQLKYVVQGKDYVEPANETETLDELDKPNTFGAMYSVPKSSAEQIKMIWEGKDYKPSSGIKINPLKK